MKPIDFEKIHEMFDGMMFDLCAECGGGGGLCEENTIAFLMPGEAEFIAAKLNIPFADFVVQFVKTVTYNGHKIYGLIDHCPFLGKTDKRCSLEKTNSKLITCLAYPATLGYPGDPNRVFIDYEDCPMAHRVSIAFKEKALSLPELLKDQLPAWWLEINADYCWPLYDYEKLALFRDRQEISLEELKACEIVNNEKKREDKDSFMSK